MVQTDTDLQPHVLLFFFLFLLRSKECVQGNDLVVCQELVKKNKKTNFTSFLTEYFISSYLKHKKAGLTEMDAVFGGFWHQIWYPFILFLMWVFIMFSCVY